MQDDLGSVRHGFSRLQPCRQPPWPTSAGSRHTEVPGTPQAKEALIAKTILILGGERLTEARSKPRIRVKKCAKSGLGQKGAPAKQGFGLPRHW